MCRESESLPRDRALWKVDGTVEQGVTDERGIDAILTIKVREVATLAEVIRPQGHYTLTTHRTQPRMRRRIGTEGQTMPLGGAA